MNVKTTALRTQIGLLCSLAIVMPSGCGTSQETASQETASQETASQETASVSGVGEWREFVSEEGRFSVLLPGVPESTTEQHSNAMGPITEYSFNLKVRPEPGRPEAFMLSYADYPPGRIAAAGEQAFLETTWQQSFGKMINDLAYQRMTNFKGHTALEWQSRKPIKRGFMVSTGRIVVAGDRLYLLNAIMNNEFTDRGDAQRYLDSFQIR